MTKLGKEVVIFCRIISVFNTWYAYETMDFPSN